MKICAILLLAVLFPVGAYADEKSKPLEGSWAVAQFERGGNPPPQELLKDFKVEIKDSTLRMFDSRSGEGGSFTLDDSKTPNEIDLVFKEGPKEDVERTAKGIYELDGDTLKLAWRKDGGPRPKEFSSLKGERTSELLILKRKPKE